jgi:hypothetical protein
MRHFFKLNFIRFFVHRNNGEKCSSESRKGFLFFCFNHLDRVVHKLFRIEEHCLYWTSGKWFVEGDRVQ